MSNWRRPRGRLALHRCEDFVRRYPIRGWACASEEVEGGALSRAMAVAATLSAIESHLEIQVVVESLATLFSVVKPVAVPIGRPKEMLGQLRAALRL